MIDDVCCACEPLHSPSGPWNRDELVGRDLPKAIPCHHCLPPHPPHEAHGDHGHVRRTTHPAPAQLACRVGRGTLLHTPPTPPRFGPR